MKIELTFSNCRESPEGGEEHRQILLERCGKLLSHPAHLAVCMRALDLTPNLCSRPENFVSTDPKMEVRRGEKRRGERKQGRRAGICLLHHPCMGIISVASRVLLLAQLLLMLQVN